MAANRQKHEELIKALVTMQEKDLGKAIHETALKLVGEEDEERLALKEQQLAAEVKEFKAPFVDAKGADFVQERVQTTTQFDKNGFAGQNTSGQIKLGTDGLGTSYFGNVAVQQNKQGSPSAVSAAVNAAFKPISTDTGTHIPIARLKTNVPLEGGYDVLKNTEVLVGEVYNPKWNGASTKVNIVAAATSDLAFKNPSVLVQASGEAYQNGNLALTPYAGSLVNVKNGNVNTYGGVRADYKTRNVDFYADVSASHNWKDNATSGQLTVGIMPGSAKPKSEIEQRFEKISAKPEPVQHDGVKLASLSKPVAPMHESHVQSESKHKSEAVQGDLARLEGAVSRELKVNYVQGMKHAYDFYKELSHQPKAQQEFLAHISENLAKSNPVLYPSAESAKNSLHTRFENQIYLEQHANQQLAAYDR